MSTKCPKCHTENPDSKKFCGDCGTPLEVDAIHTKTLETPTEELTRGSVFAGRYEIIEELGKGGMGRVYRVEDKKVKEEVALKLIKPEIASDKKTIQRFRNELTTARKIRHKNVCAMFDLGEEKGSHYITMDFIPGQDLKGLIKQSGQLAVGTTIKIAKQMIEGLAEAHRLGVVHRDLKPSNIMIDKEGGARIMDFGIARSLKGKGITGAGVMIGTPEYMSPEQVEGKEVDQRSDIYSLGIILYEMLTGSLPFEGDTPFTIGVKHKSEIPKDPKEINPQIPDDLSGLILKCMQKDKENRYQEAGELLTELNNIEQGIPTSDRMAPKRKPITSREITVTFGLKKLFIPALIVVALVITVLIIWQPWSQKETVPIPSDKPSIAVLSFDDLSPQKDQEYLCDGFAESIINALTKVEGLRVPARTSAFSFKGKGQDLQEIGEKLNVKTILEGSVQKAGNKVRITAKLINIADESLLWSEQYNRELDDVFSIQDEITLAIVDNLKIKLLEGDKERLVKRYTDNLDAYTLYIKGRSLWSQRGKENMEKAIEYFKLAIKQDPNYALAYTGIADSYSMLADNGHIPSHDGYPKGREAALKALEIDETLAEAHTSLAVVKHAFDFDWIGTEKEYKRAIELNPGYATAHHWYAWYLTSMARHDEAIKEIKLAKELDPLSWRINTNIGVILYRARKYDQAIEELKKAIKMFPDHGAGYRNLGRAYLDKSMHKEALEMFQKAESKLWICVTYMKMGKRDEAQKGFDDLINQSKSAHVSPATFTHIYFALGENDRGFEWLDKAYQERGDWMTYLKVDPFFDNIRSDPRFIELLKKMNLE